VSRRIKADEIGGGRLRERHDQPVGSGHDEEKHGGLDREQDAAIGKHAIAVERGADIAQKTQRYRGYGYSGQFGACSRLRRYQ
jgi:hypothetical protein